MARYRRHRGCGRGRGAFVRGVSVGIVPTVWTLVMRRATSRLLPTHSNCGYLQQLIDETFRSTLTGRPEPLDLVSDFMKPGGEASPIVACEPFTHPGRAVRDFEPEYRGRVLGPIFAIAGYRYIMAPFGGVASSAEPATNEARCPVVINVESIDPIEASIALQTATNGTPSLLPRQHAIEGLFIARLLGMTPLGFLHAVDPRKLISSGCADAPVPAGWVCLTRSTAVNR